MSTAPRTPQTGVSTPSRDPGQNPGQDSNPATPGSSLKSTPGKARTPGAGRRGHPFSYQAIRLTIEYRALPKYAPKGFYVLPDPADLRTWHGVYFCHSGMFMGGIFRFELTVPADYPSRTPPRIRFVCSDPTAMPFLRCVHPHTGEFDLSDTMPEWSPKEDYLWHLLVLIRRKFLNQNRRHSRRDEAADGKDAKGRGTSRAPFNAEADRLLKLALKKEDQEAVAELQRRIKSCVAASVAERFENPTGSPLRFYKHTGEHAMYLERVREHGRPGSAAGGGGVASGSGADAPSSGALGSAGGGPSVLQWLFKRGSIRSVAEERQGREDEVRRRPGMGTAE